MASRGVESVAVESTTDNVPTSPVPPVRLDDPYEIADWQLYLLAIVLSQEVKSHPLRSWFGRSQARGYFTAIERIQQMADSGGLSIPADYVRSVGNG